MPRATREKNFVQITNIEEINNRQIVERGEMMLYSAQNVPHQLPYRKALQYHKTAWIIWRMAGGAEPEKESQHEEDRSPVYAADLLRKNFFFTS